MSHRLIERVVGVRDNTNLGPLLWVSLFSTLAFSAFWSYIAIWATLFLRASATEIGIMYALDAGAAALTGYYGGQISDRVGRRRTIALAWGSEALASLLLAGIARHNLGLGIMLVVLAGAASGPGMAASAAMLADLVAPSARTGAYGLWRVVTNLASVMGPPLGGLALWSHDWSVFFSGIAALGILSAAMAWRNLPHDETQESVLQNDALALRVDSVPRHGPFVLLLISTWMGSMVYVGLEVLLPVASVTAYGLSPSQWGLLAMVNPIFVVFCQVRLTAWVEKLPISYILAASLSLMGGAFLILRCWTSVAGIIAMLVVFVLGEMLWSPTAYALASSWAPDQSRGTYLGVFGASGSLAWATGPLMGLSLKNKVGLAGLWLIMALMGVTAGLMGMVASWWGDKKA